MQLTPSDRLELRRRLTPPLVCRFKADSASELHLKHGRYTPAVVRFDNLTVFPVARLGANRLARCDAGIRTSSGQHRTNHITSAARRCNSGATPQPRRKPRASTSPDGRKTARLTRERNGGNFANGETNLSPIAVLTFPTSAHSLT